MNRTSQKYFRAAMEPAEDFENTKYVSLKRLWKAVMIFTGCIFFLLSSGSMVFGELLKEISWQSFETRYTTIHYQYSDDLKKFNKVVFYPGEWGLTQLSFGSGSNNLTDEIKMKVDAIYEKAQEILGMCRKTEKVIIKIYSNDKQLQASYSKLYKTAFQNHLSASTIRAWYTHESKTIYLNVNDLHEGILAHEIAHSIIDHYLLIRPPRSTAEILARYVDSHLFYSTRYSTCLAK